MPIRVTCPSCHARFDVSETFAGQTGPCPKCKKPIRIPDKEEEVVIHSPDEFGPKDSEGRSVLKPLEREDSAITPVMITAIVAISLGVLIAAFLLGRGADGVSVWVLGVGAVFLGPPVAFAGYGVLRDHELEPHRGMSLLLRCLICGLVYAALWGAYYFFKVSIMEGNVELFNLVFILPPMIAIGATAGLASLELDFTSGALHYGFYLLVTVLLRLLMGLPPY